MRLLSSILLITVVACSGTQQTPPPPRGSDAHGAETQGETAPGACGSKPVPAHECVGGVPASRCNAVAGAPRWQIDCVPPDPNAPTDNRGVSSCEAQQCGAEPAWDASDCVYGFAGDKASCESIDRGACTWRRRCRPKPCSPEEGTCNIVHAERLGGPCSGDVPCPSGSSCGYVSGDIGAVKGPVCVTDPPCSALTCGAGKSCLVLESYPIQIVCEKM